MKKLETLLGEYAWWIVAFILFALVASSLMSMSPQSKEPALYIGHAEYRHHDLETCFIRPITATSQKEADSLFKEVVDKQLKIDSGRLVKGNYAVWKIETKMILKAQHELHINRGY